MLQNSFIYLFINLREFWGVFIMKKRDPSVAADLKWPYEGLPLIELG